MLNKLKNKVLSGEKITVEEAEWLAGEADKEELYEAASVITREMASGHFDMCSIINAKSGSMPTAHTIYNSRDNVRTWH